jgi:tight adherence protein B
MSGNSLTVLIFIALTALAVGGIAYAFLFDRIADQRQTERRLGDIKRADTDATVKKAKRDKLLDAQKRRRSVQDNLKEFDARKKAKEKNLKSPTLKTLLLQAGLSMNVRRYYIYSAMTGVVATLLALLFHAPLILLPGVLLACSLGLPRWAVLFMRKRRVKRFLDEFPNAIDVIVRAIKSGLPLNDGLRLIANEAREPVRGEFRRIVEAQQLGVSPAEASAKLVEFVPCPEANFFGIVIAIQSQAGGNLSEALGNLSRVIRERKKMRAKVNALSMEAKASAAIIGALPFIVAFLVYLTSPAYISLLFTDPTGHIILAASGMWMSIGIFVMRNMINFKI